MRDSENGAPAAPFRLPAGAHTLEVAYREEDAKLDKLLLTDDRSFRPRRQGPTSREATSYQRHLEAEGGRLQAPMQVRRDPAASGEALIAVPDGDDNDAPGGGPGYVELPFTVPQSGEYVIYGRVRAPHGNDNSFYVSVDGGAEFAWHAPGPSASDVAEEWTWDPVSSGAGDEVTEPEVFSLKAGRHLLRIRNREDGTQLDNLIITNRPLMDRTLTDDKNTDEKDADEDMVPINGT